MKFFGGLNHVQSMFFSVRRYPPWLIRHVFLELPWRATEAHRPHSGALGNSKHGQNMVKTLPAPGILWISPEITRRQSSGFCTGKMIVDSWAKLADNDVVNGMVTQILHARYMYVQLYVLCIMHCVLRIMYWFIMVYVFVPCTMYCVSRTISFMQYVLCLMYYCM